MTKKIYEYKDDHNWFIGEWGGHGFISGLGDRNNEFMHNLSLLLRQIHNPYVQVGEDNFHPNSYAITIVKLTDIFQLIRFIVDMIVQETGRDLVVKQHGGAVLVTEGDQLVFVHLPEGGVKTADFFGQTGGFGDTILIATKNEGKTKEFRKLFAQLGIAVENLNDYPDLPDVEETGTTFEENARLKAETIAELTGKMVLSDDSGLKVDILGGLPGVWSARFSGPEATDASNRAKLLHELATVFDKENRSAQFHCTLVVAAPGRDSLVVEADWPGYIAFEEKGDNGFGYDKIFLVGEGDKTSAQLLPEEKNAIGHRGLAVKKLLEVFPAWQANGSL